MEAVGGAEWRCYREGAQQKEEPEGFLRIFHKDHKYLWQILRQNPEY